MRIKDNTVLTAVCDSKEYEISVPYYIFTDALNDPGNFEPVTLEGLTVDIVDFVENILDSDFYLSDKSLQIIEKIYGVHHESN